MFEVRKLGEMLQVWAGDEGDRKAKCGLSIIIIVEDPPRTSKEAKRRSIQDSNSARLK
jgi:hypothetical protein